MAVLDTNFILDAGKRAQLGLDDDAVIMSILHDLTGQGDVIFKALGRGVDHNGGKAAVNAGFAELEGIAVVKMKGNGNLRVFDNGCFNELDQIGVICISARALGYLQDDGALQLPCRFGDALNDFHIVDVERADGVSPVISFLEHLFRRYK